MYDSRCYSSALPIYPERNERTDWPARWLALKCTRNESARLQSRVRHLEAVSGCAKSCNCLHLGFLGAGIAKANGTKMNEQQNCKNANRRGVRH